MKITNFIFIISLLITCSYQETVQETLTETSENTMEEKTEEQMENMTETELDAETEGQMMAEEQLGSEIELQEETVEELDSEMTKTFPANYFLGNWKMLGYRCPGDQKASESCSCKMINTGNRKRTDKMEVICTKIIGDYCVTSGHETFRSRNLPDTFKSGKNMNIRYVVGNRRRPNSGHWNNRMKIVDQNTFVSQNRKYIRISAPKPAVLIAPAPIAPVAVAPVPHILIASRPAPTTGGGYIATAPRPVAPVPAQRVVYFYSNYFLGNWNGVGYVCDQFTPSIEVVNIRYLRGNLYATKILGDSCVPAKKLSFEAPLPGRLFQGLAFGVKLVIGSPKNPAARQVPGTITIIDINTFELGKHTFYRVMGPNAAHPHGVYLNMTPLVGQGGYPGPNFIKMNPKKNMRSPVRRFVIVEEETNKPANC